jgi:hypothetical protein
MSADISPSFEADCSSGSSEPEHQYVLVGHCDTPGFAHAVAVYGTYAYVADEPSGLIVIDVFTPQSPTIIAQCSSPYWARDVALSPSGDYAYVADMWNGVWVVDVSQPYAPHAVSRHDTPGEARALEVDSGLVYVADAQGGIRVVEVTNPLAPIEIGYYRTPGRAYDVCLSDTFAYVADGPSGLRVLSVADPSNLYEVGFCDTPGNAQGVELWSHYSGEYILVADGFAGIQTIDVTIPEAPHDTASYDLPGEVVDVENMWGFVYASCGSPGVQMVSYTYPWDPRRVAYYDTPGSARDVWFLWPDSFFVADGDCGLHILFNTYFGVQESPLKRLGFSLKFASNPVRGDHAKLRLTLPEPSDVSLDLYSANGRIARTYSLGHLSAGEHSPVLRISDLPSGVYFLRITDSFGYQAIKLVRVR